MNIMCITVDAAFISQIFSFLYFLQQQIHWAVNRKIVFLFHISFMIYISNWLTLTAFWSFASTSTANRCGFYSYTFINCWYKSTNFSQDTGFLRILPFLFPVFIVLANFLCPILERTPFRQCKKLCDKQIDTMNCENIVWMIGIYSHESAIFK